MDCRMRLLLLGFLLLLSTCSTTDGALDGTTLLNIFAVNMKGEYLGIVVPNAYEMDPLLQSPSFVADDELPYVDISGRRFRIGEVESKKVIMVMTGLGMVNAAIATELLLTVFKVKGVIHYGIAGNANSELQIGDVTIPRLWAHTGLWNWQRYGKGANDELALESSGDYTRKYGCLNFSEYTVDQTNWDPLLPSPRKFEPLIKQEESTLIKEKRDEQLRLKEQEELSASPLNNVWYQPEEIFPVSGTPEVREHAFWVPVDTHYYQVAYKLKDMKLEGCINATTCLPRTPEVFLVDRGCSASVFIDNAAYRQFLNTKFDVSPMDMESAAVALVSWQEGIPFIAIRALSDLAGGGSAISNEADIFENLAAQNSVAAVLRFIALL